MTTKQRTALDDNLRALKKRYPHYADLVSALPATRCVLDVSEARVLCREEDGTWIHGPENPWDEAIRDARALAASGRVSGPQLYVVLRPGLGYQAIALVNELVGSEPGSIVLIAEDRLDLLKAGLEHLDWTGVLHAKNAVVVLGSPFSVVESFLEQHPSLHLLPVMLVGSPSGAAKAEALGERMTAAADRFREVTERQLGSARFILDERRARKEPLRVVIAGGEVGYLSGPLESGFRACGCEVVVQSVSPMLARDVRAADALLEIGKLRPDIVVWVNHPEVSPVARDALRALGVACVLWSVDSPRRMGLTRADLDLVDVHGCFDAAYLDSSGGPETLREQLSLGAGIAPLPGCGPSNEAWPARNGPDISFVGALGETRTRKMREVLRRRDPGQLALLESLAVDSADPQLAYERAQRTPYAGAPCMYVEELRTKVRRLEVLSALPKASLRIFGDVEWATSGDPLASCYAGRAVRYGFELSSLYYHSKINLNVFHDQCVDSTNSRVYDVLAAGGFLLTEERPCLAREFDVGLHLATFSSPADARQKVAYYLDHPDEREAIAREGQRHVLAHHAIEHRCSRLLELARPYVGRGPTVPNVSTRDERRAADSPLNGESSDRAATASASESGSSPTCAIEDVCPDGAEESKPKGGVMRTVLNLGGNDRSIALPRHFEGWEQILLDIDPRGEPDVVCDARALSNLPGAQYDAVYCSHNLEHYHRHDVPKVLAGCLHVLKAGGFAHVRVPDLGELMRTVVTKAMDIDDILYQSPAGPIAVRDVLYGYGAEIERSGNDYYAHKTGFTRKSLSAMLIRCGFPHVYIGNGPYEIVAYAFRHQPDEFARGLLALP